MGYDDLDPQKTALLFFDMLNAYYRGAAAETQRRMELVVANAVRLRAAAKGAGLPVFYANANHRPDQKTSMPLITDTDNDLRPWPNPERDRSLPRIAEGTWESQVIEELRPDPEDYIVPKYRWSAFHQTYLNLALRVRGIDTIILSGGSTDVGIASTAFSARDMDYHLIIVKDACGCPRQDCHDFFVERVFPRMARVRTTEQVLHMLGARV